MDFRKIFFNILKDFPKRNNYFKDITPLLKDPKKMKEAHSQI